MVLSCFHTCCCLDGTAHHKYTLQEFFQDLKDVDRDNEVNRILGAFRLNPFEQLDLPFDATEADVKRQYRKVSLMVHPDKCKHPKAQDAFEIVGHAQKELRDADKTQELRAVLTAARGAYSDNLCLSAWGACVPWEHRSTNVCRATCVSWLGADAPVHHGLLLASRVRQVS